MRLGLVANEFFDRKLGRMGGFGFAARQVIRLFAENPSHGVNVHALPAEDLAFPPGAATRIHGVPATPWQGPGVINGLRLRRKLRGAAPDVFLTIDYRPSYASILRAHPRTPAIVWVHDPRIADDIRRIETLRVPGSDAPMQAGTRFIDCTSLGKVCREARVTGRSIQFATVSPYLAKRIPETYGAQPADVHLLPNIVSRPVRAEKSARPSVLFLGRLDPIKRPWLFYRLAERLQGVDFIVMGQPHGGWEPAHAPSNLTHIGHVEGLEKEHALGTAWLLVNASIHEAVALSFLEALASGTPVVSCQESGGIVKRFGTLVPWSGGDGLDLLPTLEVAVRELLDDHPRRTRLAEEGRAWVSSEHSATGFLAAFRGLCGHARVDWD